MHEFINFGLDLRTVSPTTWVLLGEIRSKLEHIASAPLRPEVAQRMQTIYLAKGVHATTAIEGNSLSEEDVRLELDKRLELPKSKEYLAHEVRNIVDACNALKNDRHEYTAEFLTHLNRQVLQGLPLSPEVELGRLRRHDVGVGNYRPPSHGRMRELVERLCQWLRDDWHGDPLIMAVLKAVVAHLYVAWIHPFGDGNGRTARLLEFCILVDAGVPQVSAHLLSNHYNQTRAEYYRSLDMARASPIAFVEYAVSGFVDGLREQLGVIRAEHVSEVWKNYVSEHLGPSTVGRRRAQLVLGLRDEMKSLEAIVAEMPGTLALQYGTDLRRGVVRDLKTCGQLVLADGDRYCANKALVLSLQTLATYRAHRQPVFVSAEITGTSDMSGRTD